MVRFEGLTDKMKFFSKNLKSKYYCSFSSTEVADTALRAHFYEE